MNEESRWKRALEYCRKYGNDPFSYLSLEPDKSLYFSKRIEGVASYSVSGRLMLVCGNPVCSSRDLKTFLNELVEYAEAKKLKLVFFFAPDKSLSIYKNAGFIPYKVGEDAILDVQNWTMSGGVMAKVRLNWNAAVNRGLSVKEYQPWVKREPEVESQFRLITKQWLTDKKIARLQFMLGSMMFDKNCDKRYFYAVDNDGVIQGFNVLNPYSQRRGWTIDIYRRRKDCPRGVMELIIHDIMEILKSEGVTEVSMGGVPLYNTINHPDPSFFERTCHFIFENMGHIYGAKTLQIFKAKFNPVWQERYAYTKERHISMGMIRSACSIIDSEGFKDCLKTICGMKK